VTDPGDATPRKPRRWRRRLVIGLGIVAAAVVVLNLLDTQVRTPVGADGVGKGTFPVVEIAGLGSNGAHFEALTAELEDAGTPVLDFDPDAPGDQPLVYQPTSSQQHIPDLAVSTVAPAIRAALARAGYDPRSQVVDVVAHSMGGLLMRYLIERPVGHWSHRVDDLVMVATPNHGSDVIWWETRLGNGPFKGVGADMRPGSAFLDSLGTAEPPGQVYTAIGGDPWIFRWYRFGHHGFDDQVPTESPFMTGAALDTFPSFHGRLLLNQDVRTLILQTLAAHA
jgi:pimeloyl-ACP methyl ester carboxylesterase